LFFSFFRNLSLNLFSRGGAEAQPLLKDRKKIKTKIN
jgi:hypothetical protein